jgi:hypothetical protein
MREALLPVSPYHPQSGNLQKRGSKRATAAQRHPGQQSQAMTQVAEFPSGNTADIPSPMIMPQNAHHPLMSCSQTKCART